MKKAISFITLGIVCVFVLGIGHKVPNVVTRHMPITPSVVHATGMICSPCHQIFSLQCSYRTSFLRVNLTPHSPA